MDDIHWSANDIEIIVWKNLLCSNIYKKTRKTRLTTQTAVTVYCIWVTLDIIDLKFITHTRQFINYKTQYLMII